MDVLKIKIETFKPTKFLIKLSIRNYSYVLNKKGNNHKGNSVKELLIF